MNVRGKIKRVQYWEWMYQALSMHNEQIKAELEQKRFEIQEKDLELQKLKQVLYKGQVKLAQERALGKKKEFENYIKDLEDQLGFSLKSCAIDEITLEVKELE